MNFVDRGSDVNTVSFIAKSMDESSLEKALDGSNLTTKQVLVHGKHGTFLRNQKVRVGEEDKQSSSHSYKLTEATKHLKPWKQGEPLPEALQKAKIAIPPKWKDVRVSETADAAVLVMGRDSANRLVYIRNEEYTKQKAAEKFKRVSKWRKKLPELDSYISNLRKTDKDCGDCLFLIREMGIRPGSTKDTKSKKQAYGATTLQGRHVVERDGKVLLEFVGKKGVFQSHVVDNPQIAEMLLRRKNRTAENGDLFDVSGAKLRSKMPKGLLVKDLRTILATTTAENMLKELPKATDSKSMEKLRKQVATVVSSKLGNTPTMALGSYIDPEVFQSHSPEGMKALQEKKVKAMKKKEETMKKSVQATNEEKKVQPRICIVFDDDLAEQVQDIEDGYNPEDD